MVSRQVQLYNTNWRLLECIKSNRTIAEKLIDVRRCLEQKADVNTTDENGSTPLHLAVRRVKAIIVKLLLKRGAKVNAQDVHGNTPLHGAVRFRETSIAELLLNKGGDINAYDELENTPLHVAAQLGRMSMGKLLLDKNANMQAQNRDGNTPLHEAVHSEKISFANLLLNNGADVNARNRRGYSPLHMAAKLGLTSIVELLLNNGADMNAQDINRDTPLYVAVGYEKTSAVKLLLSKGADVNVHDRYGTSPLLEASCSEDPTIVVMLLNEGADVNVPGVFGFTPLHGAVSYGTISVVKLLLDNGADLNPQTVNGITPLHLAARSGATSFVELLLNRGADINAQRSDGYTPLHGAARSGEMSVVEVLLNNGGNLNAQTLNKYTPLHAAARSGNISVVELLLNKGANLNAQTAEGDTPLHGAARSNETSVVELLLNKDADVNAQGSNGYTPLHAAARFKDSTVVELLLNRGAKVNAQGLDGYTPLHIAAGFETSIVELLLTRGANVNTQGTNGYSPLHVAVKSRLLSIIDLLLSKGANVNAQLTNGDTPLHLAVYSNNVAIIELLLEKGADVNAKDRDGDTPLHKTALFGETPVMKLLLNWGANVNALAVNDITPLHEAVFSKKISMVELLLNHGANLNAQKTNGDTPLHEALLHEDTAIATLLVHRGANVMLRNNTEDTPLFYALLFSFKNKAEIVSLLQNVEKKARDNALLKNLRPPILCDSLQSSQVAIPKNDQSNNQQFKYLKSTDTSGVPGQLNETKMVTLVFIRVLNHEQIENDIFLGSNMHGIGAMDDICLRFRVTGRQRPVVLFMQAKHREDPEKGRITDKDLWSDGGDFNLRKYFKSYLMIRKRFQVNNVDPMFEGEFSDVDCYFILYTSAKESITKKKTDNKVCEILHDLINTGQNTGVFQYSYNEVDINRLTEVAAEARNEMSKTIVCPNLNPIEYDKIKTKDFFSKLWFYSSQAKEDEIECKVKDEINKHYNNQKNANNYKFEIHSNAIFLKVHDEIQQWSKLRLAASYLNRSDDFFKRAKLECFDDVLQILIKAMDDFKINLNLEYNQYLKQQDASTESPKVFHTLLCRLFKIIDSKSKSISVNIDFNNKIANMLVSNERLPSISVQNNYQSQTLSKFYESNNPDATLYEDLQNNETVKFTKRAGTSEVGGTLYRTKMLSLVYLRALNHEKIDQDLLIGTKIRGINVMSDICLRCKVKGLQRPVVLFMQLVHREDTEKGRLTEEEVWKDSGNFSLRKYFASYLEIKDQFQVGNKDPMFEGDFCNVDCYFILCTPVKESFTKKRTECQVSGVVQDIISTTQNTKPFQYDHDEVDIDRLTKVTVMDRIVKLGTVFIKLVDFRKIEIYKPNILIDKVIATYHVALRREVLQLCKTQEPNKEYRNWEFSTDFFESDLEHLIALKRTFVKILSPKRCQQSKVNNESQRKEIDDVRIKLLRLKLKLPVAFGNLDMTFRGSEDKVQKRMKTLADKLMSILELNKDSKIIEVNDDDVGPGKIIDPGTLGINGGIGSAIGNLLVFDTDSNMLKFEMKSLPPNAALFLKELKDDRYAPHNDDLSSYRIRINVNGFPKDSFNEGDENDKSQARHFLNNFWFYSNQAKEDEVENILRDKINAIYSDRNICSGNNSHLISLHYLDEMQKWWIQINESAYLSRASELFERAELADIYNLLQTVINYMYILNIDSMNIKVKRTNTNEKYEHNLHKVFKKISTKLLNLFDPQYNESISFQLRGSDSIIFDRVNLSLRIDPEMKWVALILMAESGGDKYRIFAKAGPNTGGRRAKDSFMIYEQNFNGPYCISTRNCITNIFV